MGEQYYISQSDWKVASFAVVFQNVTQRSPESRSL